VPIHPAVPHHQRERQSRSPGGPFSNANRNPHFFGVMEMPVKTGYKLLPLHFSFCRTTLKNEASGNEASGSVFFALRIVTIDPRST
jgi:hypothetical protein